MHSTQGSLLVVFFNLSELMQIKHTGNVVLQ
uniref:Uncharacterized protein n=1 Tax=Anguilla anguilla TaxID=7936 RepID=A0A0E9Y142_ANGAN